MPIDPVQPARGDSPRNTPPFINEDPNLEAVNYGLEAAENELREASYAASDDPEAEDLSGEEIDGRVPVAPEIAAMHEEDAPRNL